MMNINLLIDAIVRQTTILIAHLATAAGARATLANTANKVFRDLIHELKEQGLSNKVIADMFGLTLRTYYYKVSSLSESHTEKGHSIWEAVLLYVREKKTVLRNDILLHFSHDDPATVKSVLKELVDTGLVFSTGRGNRLVYRAASNEEMKLGDRNDNGKSIANLLWVAIDHHGPINRASLKEVVPASDRALDAALDELVNEGLVIRSDDSEPEYTGEHCVIPFGDPTGWEAAIFDHYQAMVIAICAKLSSGQPYAKKNDWIGGSTYEFSVWEGHPFLPKATSFLQHTRERAIALREEIDAYNEQHKTPVETIFRVLAYVGQTVIGPETEIGEEQ
jgi:hypothetical protein